MFLSLKRRTLGLNFLKFVLIPKVLSIFQRGTSSEVDLFEQPRGIKTYK
jgi:hypothetical protein